MGRRRWVFVWRAHPSRADVPVAQGNSDGQHVGPANRREAIGSQRDGHECNEGVTHARCRTPVDAQHDNGATTEWDMCHIHELTSVLQEQ